MSTLREEEAVLGKRGRGRGVRPQPPVTTEAVSRANLTGRSRQVNEAQRKPPCSLRTAGQLPIPLTMIIMIVMTMVMVMMVATTIGGNMCADIAFTTTTATTTTTTPLLVVQARQQSSGFWALRLT